MKLATGERDDEEDMKALLETVPAGSYQPLRKFVAEHLGAPASLRLDVLAREIGHPGPGRRRVYSRKRGRGSR
jgi:hypothetical protein